MPDATAYRKAIPERKRSLHTGRGKLAPFIGIPRRVLDSPEFGGLSGNAVKLAVELARQFRGRNNGDFSCPWSGLRLRGWRSPGTLARAKKELIDTGFAIVTRQGGRHQCSLFALSWWAVDDCNGKHDERATIAPPDLWMRRNG